jgi:hypothetical protein
MDAQGKPTKEVKGESLSVVANCHISKLQRSSKPSTITCLEAIVIPCSYYSTPPSSSL